MHDNEKRAKRDRRGDSGYRQLRIIFEVETRLWNVVNTEMLNRCGLTLARVEVLFAIESLAPDVRTNDVADHLVITTGGASKLVESLYNTGHVRRRENPSDRRSSLLVLTLLGEEQLQKAADAFAEIDNLIWPDAAARDTVAAGLLTLRNRLTSLES